MLKKYVPIIKKYYHARGHNHNSYENNSLGFGFIHYSLIRNIRPKNILVVGSQRGFVPAICALACKHEKKGHVHFVDAGYSLKHPHSWGGIGVWKTVTSDYWEPLGIEDYISLYCMTTEKFEKKIEGMNSIFEYIYIDGDHSYKGIKRDFNLFWKYLKGYMTFHDISINKLTDWGKCGVKKFWKEIAPKYKSINIPTDCGLGIIQK